MNKVNSVFMEITNLPPPTSQFKGGRHSSVKSSAPTIMWARLESLAQNLCFFNLYYLFKLNWNVKRTKISKKRTGFLKSSQFIFNPIYLSFTPTFVFSFELFNLWVQHLQYFLMLRFDESKSSVELSHLFGRFLNWRLRGQRLLKGLESDDRGSRLTLASDQFWRLHLF